MLFPSQLFKPCSYFLCLLCETCISLSGFPRYSYKVHFRSEHPLSGGFRGLEKKKMNLVTFDSRKYRGPNGHAPQSLKTIAFIQGNGERDANVRTADGIIRRKRKRWRIHQ